MKGYSYISILASLLVIGLLVALSVSYYTRTNPETGESNINSYQNTLDDASSLADRLNEQTRQQNSIINEGATMDLDISQFENISQAILKTSKGDIVVEFYKDASPKTVANFLQLARDNFYDGTRFHRVIKDFMIQGGDPLSKDDSLQARWGTGDPGYKFEDEFNSELLVRGSLAMANSGPNTNGSQFFIVTAQATPWLDGRHTNFGHVVQGMDVVDAIESTQTGMNDRPLEPITIVDIVLQ